VLPLLLLHVVLTLLPLLLLPGLTWQSPLVPTLEGQYIIKNLVILAAALGIASHLHIHSRKS
jgi:putative oxidoreductase